VRKGEASRTAEYMALFRALEGCRSPRRRLFVDPLARGFLRPPLRGVVDLARLPGLAELACRFIDRRWPGARTSAVARTKLIDERVSGAVARGIRQLVILGAGFDARAWRLPACRTCVVFEVDHPATQARKRELLPAGDDAAAADVRFVPTDFDREEVSDALAAAGYEGGRPTLFLWEGVTNYLTPDAVDRTLRWCAAAAPESQLLFSYVDREVLDAPQAFFGTARLLASLEAAGERWTFGLDPAGLEAYLRERGLRLLEDVGASQYRAACYGAEAQRMRGYEFYRIARVEVPAWPAGRLGWGGAGRGNPRRERPLRVASCRGRAVSPQPRARTAETCPRCASATRASSVLSVRTCAWCSCGPVCRSTRGWRAPSTAGVAVPAEPARCGSRARCRSGPRRSCAGCASRRIVRSPGCAWRASAPCSGTSG
jgi:methyltransferase (TIGR00027 family)